MKGAASKILIGLGIILILAAILWWAIAVNALVKLPKDVEVEINCEGEMTLYVNPSTGEMLPEGSEMEVPIQVEVTGIPDKTQFDSSTGVVKEVAITRIQGMPEQRVEAALVLDRKTIDNVKDDRAFAYKYTDSEGREHPGVSVNREGYYFPLLPLDTSKDQTYQFWKEEIAGGFELEYVNEEEKEGVAVYNFKASYDDKEVCDAYVEYMNLPKEMSLDRIKPVLVSMGMDVDGLVSLATQVMKPEDLQALNQALQGSIPLKYYWSQEYEVSVEPKSGYPVDVYKDVEALSMKIDLTMLTNLSAIFMKYAQDPVLGPALTKLQGLQSLSGEMSAPKVFEYNIEQTDQSVKDGIDDAKKAGGAINLFKVYIPWALLIVGALILIIGLLIGGGGVPQEEE